MKIKVQVGRTFPTAQFANYRPEFTIEQDVSEEADTKSVIKKMEEWRKLLDEQLEKAEQYHKGLTSEEQTS